MSDKEVMGRWTEAPYTSYDKRSWRIEHRVVVESYDGSTADVRHEIRSDDPCNVPDDWTEIKSAEVRSHGMRIHGSESGYEL